MARLKLCASIMPRREADLPQLAAGCRSADLVELRLDYLPFFPLQQLRSTFRQPLILTWRSPQQGGFCSIDLRQRIILFRKALQTGMDYLDVEWEQADLILPQLPAGARSHLILSCHTEVTDPARLQGMLEQMLQVPAAVYKLVFTAAHLNHSILALQLLKSFREQRKPLVIHAMGEAGMPSRLLGALQGNFWTYVSVEVKSETAAGQFTLQQLRDVYRLPQKNSRTRLFGLLGYPLNQSRGWQLHNRLLNRFCEPDFGLYFNLPGKNLPEIWPVWAERMDGFSITMPHKAWITAMLQRLSPAVARSGVCNTVVKHNQHWYGFNTDFMALYRILAPHREQLADGVLVYGTGATAVSAISALQQMGIKQIKVSGRNRETGQRLAQRFGISYLMPGEAPAVPPGGFIQATPVGMAPAVEAVPAIAAFLQPGCLVLDCIYNPPETALLKKAAERGCRTISGVEMFLQQAVYQFRLFTGLEIPPEAVREVWQEIRP
ncbi:MAG: type I 3-dehydroquinate dehydratase [Calditrichia bacterium]